MRPSDLVKDFGRPVAYYPGLVKYLGSVNATILFCQFFYWTGKEVSELGIYKSTEEIEQETGLSYEEQLNARKKLKKRGVLKELNKRLEHRIYYRIDTDRLDVLISQVIDNSPNGQSPNGEMGKTQPANTEKPNSPDGQNPVGEHGKPDFVHTESTSENTTEITSPDGADKSAPQAEGELVENEGNPPDASEKDAETAFQQKCRAAWRAYAEAYFQRYQTAPVRNGKINTLVKQLVTRLGAEAAGVAGWYVLSVNESFIVRKVHDLGLLVKNAEGYRTQWAIGRPMTSTRANQLDQTAANHGSAEEAKAILRAKRQRERGQDA